MRLLASEDEPRILELLQSAFRRAGFEFPWLDPPSPVIDDGPTDVTS
jgi:DNA-binding response OmpR family regulator